MEAIEQSKLEHHFATLPQQREAASLGMWVFLGTEVMFFGVLFMSYAVYRLAYPSDFALAAATMEKTIGTINTAILLTSSAAVALGVHFARASRRLPVVICTASAALSGLIFEVLKAREYLSHYKEHLLPGVNFHFGNAKVELGAELFYTLYFVMTGVHALHVAIGVVLFACLAALSCRKRYVETHGNVIENAGLYWHFVDLVWLFLYPIFYLLGPSQ